jgi:hypothetical protein
MLDAQMILFTAALLILAGKSNQPARAIIKRSLASRIKTFGYHAASRCVLVSIEFSDGISSRATRSASPRLI